MPPEWRFILSKWETMKVTTLEQHGAVLKCRWIWYSSLKSCFALCQLIFSSEKIHYLLPRRRVIPLTGNSFITAVRGHTAPCCSHQEFNLVASTVVDFAASSGQTALWAHCRAWERLGTSGCLHSMVCPPLSHSSFFSKVVCSSGARFYMFFQGLSVWWQLNLLFLQCMNAEGLSLGPKETITSSWARRHSFSDIQSQRCVFSSLCNLVSLWMD